jgi:hypothetical protein
MVFDQTACRMMLDSNDFDAASAIRMAVDSIPDSLPMLPFLYAKHRSTLSPAIRSWSFASICRFGSLAVPYLLDLLSSQDACSRCDAIHLLADGNRVSARIAYPYLPPRKNKAPNWGEDYATVIERLGQLLRDPIREVRVWAAIALDDIHETPKNIVPILMDGLKSDDPTVCYNASKSLGRLECNATIALPALKQFVELSTFQEGPVIRPTLAAQIAIRRIEGKEQNDAHQALDQPS